MGIRAFELTLKHEWNLDMKRLGRSIFSTKKQHEPGYHGKKKKKKCRGNRRMSELFIFGEV